MLFRGEERKQIMKHVNGNEWKDAAICQHYFEDNSNYYGAVTPPIVQTTLFTFDTFDAFIEASNHERENHLYCRGVNPTTEILEKKLARLECGEQAKVFGSGMGAISATLFTLLGGRRPHPAGEQCIWTGDHLFEDPGKVPCGMYECVCPGCRGNRTVCETEYKDHLL